jgi:hypothetical protein
LNTVIKEVAILNSPSLKLSPQEYEINLIVPSDALAGRKVIVGACTDKETIPIRQVQELP